MSDKGGVFSVRYDTRSGQYIDDRGSRIPRTRILAIIPREQRVLERKLEQHAVSLVNGGIDEFEWQRRVKRDLKESHLKMATLGAGGKEGITARHKGQVGAALRQEYNLLFDFRKEIQQQKLSQQKIIARTKSYSRSISQSYHRSEQLSRAQGGARLGKRILDVNAKHCRQCPAYVTNGFVPIDQVVPPGTRCDCRGNCKCIVIYRVA